MVFNVFIGMASMNALVELMDRRRELSYQMGLNQEKLRGLSNMDFDSDEERDGMRQKLLREFAKMKEKFEENEGHLKSLRDYLHEFIAGGFERPESTPLLSEEEIETADPSNFEDREPTTEELQ